MQETSALISDVLTNGKDLRPREARKTKDSTMDRIWKYYHDKKRQQNLTEDEHKVRERWEKAWFLLCSHKNMKDASEEIEKMFNVKRSVAYDDVRNAMLLFGDPRNDMKDAKRALAESMVLKGLEKAWAEGDLEVYYRFVKEYKEINQLNVAEDGRLAEILRKMRPTTVVFVASKEQLERQAQELMKNVPTVDVDYEDADEEETQD